MMQQTSIDAYHDALSSGRINQRQGQVMQALVNMGRACSKDISDSTGIPPNVVTPRILELREKGLVEKAHEDRNPSTGRRSIYWRVAA